MENGEWRVANEEWEEENLKNGDWKMENEE